MNIVVTSENKVLWQGKVYPCASGKGGFTTDKKEGDGATPVGCFPIRRVFYRPDRFRAVKTDLPVQVIHENDGWCDDPEDERYNRLIRLPASISHEKMWREDGLYDVVVEIGYNDDPPVKGRGSAIFMHVARPGYAPTEGCVAMTLKDLLEVIKTAKPETMIEIKP